jgi:peroxiredoxin
LTAAEVYALLRQQGVGDLSQVGYLLYETPGTTTLIGAGSEPGPLMREGLSAAGCRHVAESTQRHVADTPPVPPGPGQPDSEEELPMSLLYPGDAFPELTLTVSGGKTVTVPEAFADQFGVVLFYRGAWCPYCQAQLRTFQRASATLADAGVQVAALSVDDEATTADLIAKHGLTFPVGFGADARAIADRTGAFVNPDPVYLQSTGFVLDPAGKVVVSVYSSGAIGRLVPDDVAGLVRYVREHAATSA